MVAGSRKPDGGTNPFIETQIFHLDVKRRTVSTQTILDEKKSYVACIDLPLVMNMYLKFLGGTEPIMQKETLVHVDNKPRH
jgi:hypothetical protein